MKVKYYSLPISAWNFVRHLAAALRVNKVYTIDTHKLTDQIYEFEQDSANQKYQDIFLDIDFHVDVFGKATSEELSNTLSSLFCWGFFGALQQSAREWIILIRDDYAEEILQEEYSECVKEGINKLALYIKDKSR